MLDAIVQLIRNLLCCIKDLDLLSDTWLYNAKVTNQFYDFPEPLNQTTPLEAMISVVQFYVVYTGVPSAWNLFWMSYGKLQRIYRLMEGLKSAKTDTDRLINESLVKEAFFALRSMFVGFNVFFISFAFLWPSANSWHITETDWMGGLPVLIHALTVMNVCLFPLLYYMYKDAKEQFVKAATMKALAVKLRAGEVTEADIGLPTLEALADWLPFWDSGVGFFESGDNETETKLIVELMVVEKAQLKTLLDDITGATASKKKGDSEEDAAAIRTRIQREKADQLEPAIAVTRLEGYREFVYFVLNSIAWYGYTLCVLVYYWPEELKQPFWLRLAMFQLVNDDADWHGNFAGDLMWTIEPLIVLGSPIYLNALRTQAAKQRATKDKAKAD